MAAELAGSTGRLQLGHGCSRSAGTVTACVNRWVDCNLGLWNGRLIAAVAVSSSGAAEGPDLRSGGFRYYTFGRLIDSCGYGFSRICGPIAAATGACLPLYIYRAGDGAANLANHVRQVHKFVSWRVAMMPWPWHHGPFQFVNFCRLSVAAALYIVNKV